MVIKLINRETNISHRGGITRLILRNIISGAKKGSKERIRAMSVVGSRITIKLIKNGRTIIRVTGIDSDWASCMSEHIEPTAVYRVEKVKKPTTKNSTK